MDATDRLRSNDTGPATLPIFPTFDWIRVQMPIVAAQKTIWPGPKETYWDWVKGFPLELHPFAWDYLWICCDGHEVRIEPHYVESTWDTFWTNGSGHVRADAFRGLFPFTLGKQVDLLEGIVATLEALPPLIADQNPDYAAKIQQIHGILKTRETSHAVAAAPARHISSLRRSASEFVWRRKLKRLSFDSGDEGSSQR